MTDTLIEKQYFPRTLSFYRPHSSTGHQPCEIEINSGMTVLVGPNGSGKTQALRAIKSTLQGDENLRATGKVVRYLSSGRTSPFETYRASISSPQYINTSPASVGQQDHLNKWSEIESATGDLLVLENRADLRLKLEARLQTLYNRSLQLVWGQSGLRLEFRSLQDGATYYANAEASGLLHLISILASLYNDRVSALIIDEPEISLHPQLQAFFLQEAERCAGDPIADPAKKLVVIATHSTNILPVRGVSDLPKLVFFSDRETPPSKLSKNANELQSRRLAGLVSRMSESHKTAFFAQCVLLVEGPSDEIIVSGLAAALEHSLLGGNTQVVPVTGKGAFPDAMKLFKLASKRVVVLGDLDSIIDENSLVAAFAQTAQGLKVANEMGATSLIDLDRALRTELASMSTSSWSDIATLAAQNSYWINRDNLQPEEIATRRAVCGTLLTSSASEIIQISNGSKWLSLKTRLEALLDALEKAGCFVLRRGAIEAYYASMQNDGVKKPEAAAREIEGWQDSAAKLDLESRYADLIRAMRFAAPLPKIDENYLLREKLGAILGSVFQSMRVDMSDTELNSRASAILGPDADIFKLMNISRENQKRLKVDIASSLFRRSTFPFEISEKDNLTAIIMEKLPSV
ncbi:AAA family ATPase [Agrobacterium genomosp. 3 str. CIP 111-78]|uniref:ATP-dependent endonuclease n=1 Tax=Agrobacterium tumefaciens TaxID=358 RepID=A0AAE6BQQ9_AGRTU|nr:MULTISPECIES: AAA family ATPase [Agrobacterium tumefaciens complex]MCA2370855.1 AAA family ATPase [Agrobacterium tomkonis CIP 111-78]QCM02603.1 ATP-dependent endonuclease [Agrobacterium tumefaciens]